VLDNGIGESMTPSARFNTVDEENMVGIQDEVVDESRGISHFPSIRDLVGKHPLAVDSHGMFACDRQATREGDQTPGSITGNFKATSDSGATIGGRYLVSLLHLGDLSFSLTTGSICDHYS